MREWLSSTTTNLFRSTALINVEARKYYLERFRLPCRSPFNGRRVKLCGYLTTTRSVYLDIADIANSTDMQIATCYLRVRGSIPADSLSHLATEGLRSWQMCEGSQTPHVHRKMRSRSSRNTVVSYFQWLI